MWTENRLELGTSPPGSVENIGLFIALSAQTVHHPLGVLGSERLFRKAQLHPQAWRHPECDRASGLEGASSAGASPPSLQS